MDFTKCGALHIKGAVQRAHVQWWDNGANRHIYGPFRPSEEAAKQDLESMRAAASGMSREDGFAAMKVEADELKAGKPPKEVGFIQHAGNAFRVRVQLQAALRCRRP